MIESVALEVQIVTALLLTLLCLTAIAVVRMRGLFAAVMLMGIFSFLGAGWMLLLDAPDVAFTEAAVGAGISTILALATLAQALGCGFLHRAGAGFELGPEFVDVARSRTQEPADHDLVHRAAAGSRQRLFEQVEGANLGVARVGGERGVAASRLDPPRCSSGRCAASRRGRAGARNGRRGRVRFW